MSWHRERFRYISARQQSKDWQYSYTTENRQVTVTLNIPGMKNDEDCHRISNELGSLPGVIGLNIVPERRWLVVTYNMSQTTLETIGHHLAAIGYSYTQKA